MENSTNIKAIDNMNVFMSTDMEYYCTIAHPDSSGRILRVRHDFLIFRNDKVLLYPKLDTVSKYRVSHKAHTFILPGIYPYSKDFNTMISNNIDIQQVTAEYIIRMPIITTHEYYLMHVDLYDKPVTIEIINSDDTVEIYGDYVYTHIMNYAGSTDIFYIKELKIENLMNTSSIWKYDYGYTDDDSFNMDKYFTASVNDTPIWVEYFTVIGSNGNKNVANIVEYFATKTSIRNSLVDRLDPVEYLENMIVDFIYHTPIMSYMSCQKLSSIESLFKNIAINLLLCRPVIHQLSTEILSIG